MGDDERETDGGDGSRDRKRRGREAESRPDRAIQRSVAQTGSVVSGVARSDETVLGSSGRSEGVVLGSNGRSDDDADAADRTDPVADLHRSVGNQAVQRFHEAGPIHRRHRTGAVRASPTVSQPGDRDEREADRVARAVMRSEDPGPVAEADGIQRRSESGGATSDGGSAGDGGVAGGGAEQAVRSVQGGGQSLPDGTRSFFESRFGQDFSDVSVHTGSEADRAARSINAEAFTTGSDVAFARGNYDPASSSGKELLAHELTHVVQQGASEPTASAGGGSDVARSVDDGADAPAVQRQQAQGGERFGTYTVKEGDTLWGIAEKLGIGGGPKRIAEWNGMSVEDVIRPDDELKVPAEKVQNRESGGGDGGSSEATPVDQGSGGTGASGGWQVVEGAAEAIGWVQDSVAGALEGAGAAGGSKQSRETHEVQEGERVSTIAEEHGVSVEALKRANEDKLHTWDGVEGFMAGAVVVVPDSEAQQGDGSGQGGENGQVLDRLVEAATVAGVGVGKILDSFGSVDKIREVWSAVGERIDGFVAWIREQFGGGGSDATTEPRWIQVARQEVGTKEKGPDWGRKQRGKKWGTEDTADKLSEQKEKSNTRIEEYHKAAGITDSWSIYHGGSSESKGAGDHVYWCGSFVTWALKQSGHYSSPPGGHPAGASSWVNWGEGTSNAADAKYGSVTVVNGGGHVGFLVGKSGGTIQLLGGNQNDEVNVSGYSASGAKYFGLPSGYDTSTLPSLEEEEAKEGGDTL